MPQERARDHPTIRGRKKLVISAVKTGFENGDLPIEHGDFIYWLVVWNHGILNDFLIILGSCHHPN